MHSSSFVDVGAARSQQQHFAEEISLYLSRSVTKMTRAKGKTPSRVSTAKRTESPMSPALTRSLKKTSRALSRISTLTETSSPGWQAAHPDMFKSPGFTSPLQPKPSRRMTRRSSIYQTTSTSVSIPKKAFKAPAPVVRGKRQSIYKAPKETTVTTSRRSSVYQKSAGVLSPVQTRSRRTSMYAFTTEFSKVFRTPDEASLRRQSMIQQKTAIITASPPLQPAAAKSKKPSPKAKKSPPKAKKTPPREKPVFTKLVTPPKQITSSVSSPESPEDLEVTFNTVNFYSKSPAQAKKSNIAKKASPPKPKARSPKTMKAVKAQVKSPAAKARPVSKLNTPKKSTPKTTKSAGKQESSAKKSPASNKKPAKVTKSKLPVTSPSDQKVAKTSGLKRTSPGKSSSSPPKKAKTAEVPVASKSTPKTATPKAQNAAVKSKVTPVQRLKSTPTTAGALAGSTIKVTPKSREVLKKAAKTSPRVRLAKTPAIKHPKSAVIVTPGVTPSPSKITKTYPKTPIRLIGMDSPKTPAFQTPTGANSPKKKVTVKALIKKTPSSYQTPPTSKTPAPITGQKSTPSSKKVTKSVSKLTKTVGISKSDSSLNKGTPQQKGKALMRVASSPALSSNKKPLQKSPSRVKIATPPKAAKILGKTPASKVKERKVTPGRATRSSNLALNTSIPRTSTPVGERRKRPAEFPLSEIRQSKRLQVTEMSTVGAMTLTEEKTIDTLDADMRTKEMALLDETPHSGSWFGGWCTIL